jgi:hypothetical protein
MEPFRMSLDTILKDAGLEQTGTDNGVPVFEMKVEPVLTEEQIDEDDCYLESTC